MTSPNVFLITADGLRYDRVSSNGYHRKTTPTIDSITSSGGHCEQAIATGPGTRLSFPGILTSSYPLMYGGYAQLTPHRTSIASIFRDLGYVTLGVNTNAQLHRRFGWDRGFDVYFDSESTVVNGVGNEFFSGRDGQVDSSTTEENENGKAESGLSASIRDDLYHRLDHDGIVYRSLERVYRKLNGRSLPHPEADAAIDRVLSFVDAVPDDRPIFLWVHFMETHSPYIPPAEYRDQFLDTPLSESRIWTLNDTLQTDPDSVSDDEVDIISNLYDASLRYLDDEIGRMIDGLQERNQWDQAIVGFTSDHGEQFREHGGLNHCSQPYDEGIHVPLIFRFGNRELRNIEDVVSTIDLAPTLISAATGDEGVSIPETFHGVSLVPALTKGSNLFSDRIVFSQVASGGMREVDLDNRVTGCRTTRWKYITSKNEIIEEKLFDLRSDPKEQHNIIDQHPDVKEWFDDQLREHYRQSAYTDFDVEEAVDTGSVTGNLKALGYLNE